MTRVACVAVGACLAGCDGDHVWDGGDPPAETGTIAANLVIQMTDRQVLDREGHAFEPPKHADWVAFEGDDLTVVGEDGAIPVTSEIGWLEVRDLDEETRFELGQGTVDASFYSEIHLTVQAAGIVVDNVEYELQVEAGETEGFVAVTDFCVFEGDVVTLELMWELASNVREVGEGQYVLTPIMGVDGAPFCEQMQ